MAKISERTPIRARGLRLIPYGSRGEWLEIRRGYLGGSDAGAVVGLSPCGSAFSVWAEKTGRAPAFGGSISTRVGNALEDFVAKLFVEETGKKVQRLNYVVVNPAYPWACANIDREILGEDALLEIKTTSAVGPLRQFRGGECPEKWYGQLAHYLAVTGAKKAYLAALENNRALRVFTLERDEEELRALMEAERACWNNYVLTGKAPPADGHPATTEAIRALFPAERAAEADLRGMEEFFRQRRTLSERGRSVRAEIDGIDNRIKLAMGSSETGVCDGWRVSWKTRNTGVLDREKLRADFPDVDFTEYLMRSRVFRVSEYNGR